MNYKDISDKWKSFLFENTFKEDVIFDPEQEKKKKKKKKEKNAEKKREDGKEIITNEYEEFGEDPIEETSTVSGLARTSHAVETSPSCTAFVVPPERDVVAPTETP